MALKLVDQNVTSFYTQIASGVWAGLANDDGLVIFGFYDSSLCNVPKSTASIYSPGCILINKAGSSASTAIIGNSGSTASPTWTAYTIS